MRSTRRDALLAGGVVVALAVVGVAVFLFSGSQGAVLFFVAGVPVILIVGGIAWHRRETRSSGTESPRIKSMTDDLAGDVRELFTTYQRLDAETPWDPSEQMEAVQEIQRDLENRGFEISVDSDGVSVEVVEYSMGIGAISKQRENIRSVLDSLESGYRDDVESEIETMNDQLDRLIAENLLDPSTANGIDGVGGAGMDPQRLTDVLQDRRRTFQNLLDDAVGRVHDVTGPAVVDWEQVTNQIAAGRYAAATDLVVEPGTEMPDPGPKKADLLDLIDAVNASVATQYADPSRFETLESVRSEVEAIDSAYEMEELEATLRPQAVQTCTEIIDDLRGELIDYVEMFSRPEIPDGFFERPSILDRSLKEQLLNASDIEAFRERWSGIVDDLAAALSTAAEREGALQAYGDIVDVVERTLATDGEVTVADVPYDPAEPIMRLYAHRNTDVTFLENRPALTQGADIAGQEFDLDVDLRLDPPESREVTVGVTIRDETHQRTQTLDGAGRISFDGILGGEATVTASADDDRFGSRETELVLDRDRTVEFRLAEETAIDRLCAGVQTNAELLLSEVKDDIAARYETEQYLTDGMDLGVQGEYVACVLALWADDAGLSVRVEDDTVLVYDRQRMQNQLVDLTEQRLGNGEELMYEEIRERFLKPPASDDLIRDILAQAELGIEVELGDEMVVSA